MRTHPGPAAFSGLSPPSSPCTHLALTIDSPRSPSHSPSILAWLHLLLYPQRRSKIGSARPVPIWVSPLSLLQAMKYKGSMPPTVGWQSPYPHLQIFNPSVPIGYFCPSVHLYLTLATPCGIGTPSHGIAIADCGRIAPCLC